MKCKRFIFASAQYIVFVTAAKTMARVEGTRRPLCVLMSVLMSVLTLFTSSTSSDALTSMATFDYFYNWSIPASLLQPASVAMTTSKLRCASMCGLTPGCKGFVFSCLTSHPAHTCECYVSLNVNVSSGYPSTGSIVGLLVEGVGLSYSCYSFNFISKCSH